MTKCEFLDARFNLDNQKAYCNNDGISTKDIESLQYPFTIRYNFLCPKHIKTCKLWVKNHR